MSQARLLAQIRREFQEHPGIALTLLQARRLWSLDERAGTEAFDALIAEGFLQRATRQMLQCQHVRRETRGNEPEAGSTRFRGAPGTHGGFERVGEAATYMLPM